MGTNAKNPRSSIASRPGGTPTAVPKVTGAADTAIAQSPGSPVLYAQGSTLYFSRTITATQTLNGIYRYAAGDTS